MSAQAGYVSSTIDDEYTDAIGMGGTVYDSTFPGPDGWGTTDSSGSDGAYPQVGTGGNIPYELGEFPTVSNDSPGPGITDYDPGIPLFITEAPEFHPTESYRLSGMNGTDTYVAWSDIDYEIGGTTGAVDRNAYVSGTMGTRDAHSFRGDHPVIPARGITGSYGDAGNSDDPAIAYAQGLAAGAWPSLTSEDSQNAMSLGY